MKTWGFCGIITIGGRISADCNKPFLTLKEPRRSVVVSHRLGSAFPWLKTHRLTDVLMPRRSVFDVNCRRCATALTPAFAGVYLNRMTSRCFKQSLDRIKGDFPWFSMASYPSQARDLAATSISVIPRSATNLQH